MPPKRTAAKEGTTEPVKKSKRLAEKEAAAGAAGASAVAATPAAAPKKAAPGKKAAKEAPAAPATPSPAASPEKTAAAPPKASSSSSPPKKQSGGKLEEGDVLPAAPELPVETHEGEGTHLAALCADQPIIIFFYPRANTPGCTKQACGFRDNYEAIKAAGYGVYGMVRFTTLKLHRLQLAFH